MKIVSCISSFSCKSNEWSYERFCARTRFFNRGTRCLGNALFALRFDSFKATTRFNYSFPLRTVLADPKTLKHIFMLGCAVLDNFHSTSELNSEMKCARLITIFVGHRSAAACQNVFSIVFQGRGSGEIDWNKNCKGDGMQEQVARPVYRLILKCVARTRNFTSQCKNCFKQTN